MSTKEVPSSPVVSHIILFYKYGQLSSDLKIMEPYRDAMKELCQSLDLMGRVLIGVSDSAEGINGTLSGKYENVHAYTVALLGPKAPSSLKIDDSYRPQLQKFWDATALLSEEANVPLFYMNEEQDFKWSTCKCEDELFPDLKIALQKELINTGGELSSIDISDTSKGYLTPKEWHEKLLSMQQEKKQNDEEKDSKEDDFVLIDCRNKKEYAIGHFENALDPQTKTYEQFPTWVKNSAEKLENKQVYMYCTGGIRCEKASAYIRKIVPTTKGVYHLKGGIHKYLEEFGSEGLFRGKNFVFDGRMADDPSTKTKNMLSPVEKSSEDETKQEENTTMKTNNVVGKCLYCGVAWDTFDNKIACTVCRELVLICSKCRQGVVEYHCDEHYHLRDCYFTNLNNFPHIHELQSQCDALQELFDEIKVGRKYKRKRNTLRKQIIKIQTEIISRKESKVNSTTENANKRKNEDDTSAIEGKTKISRISQ